MRVQIAEEDTQMAAAQWIMSKEKKGGRERDGWRERTCVNQHFKVIFEKIKHVQIVLKWEENYWVKPSLKLQNGAKYKIMAQDWYRKLCRYIG